MRWSSNIKIDAWQNGIKNVITSIGFASSEALIEEGDNILKTSNILAPEDTGTMISTGYVKVVKDQRAGMKVEVGYTGDAYNKKSQSWARDYMLQQHEDLSLFHYKGEAKFLEKAMARRAEYLKATISKKMTYVFNNKK